MALFGDKNSADTDNKGLPPESLQTTSSATGTTTTTTTDSGNGQGTTDPTAPKFNPENPVASAAPAGLVKNPDSSVTVPLNNKSTGTTEDNVNGADNPNRVESEQVSGVTDDQASDYSAQFGGVAANNYAEATFPNNSLKAQGYAVDDSEELPEIGFEGYSDAAKPFSAYKHRTVKHYKVGPFEFQNHILVLFNKDSDNAFRRLFAGLPPMDQSQIVKYDIEASLRVEQPVMVERGALSTSGIKDPKTIA